MYFVLNANKWIFFYSTSYHVVEKLCEPMREKTNNLGSDQVQHKSACTVTEDG